MIADKILAAVCEFEFLTRRQMVDAGVDANRTHLGEVLRAMVRRKEIGEIRPGVTPETGRLAYVYYLQKRGAELLAEVQRRPLELLPYRKKPPTLRSDYHHRLVCVDFHIAARLRFGYRLKVYQSYYSVAAGKLKQATRVPVGTGAMVPDALFMVDDGTGQHLYAMEYSAAKTSSDAGRIVSELETHADAMRAGAVGEFFGLKRNHRVLCLFRERKVMEAVRQRINIPREASKWFKAAVVHDGDVFPEQWANL